MLTLSPAGMDWSSLPAEILRLCYTYTQQARIDHESSVLKDRCFSKQASTPSAACCHGQPPAPSFTATTAGRRRLRSEAVCRHWRAVLRELPLEELRVEVPLPEGARRWLTAANPRVHSLRCFEREQNAPPTRFWELLSALEPQVGRWVGQRGGASWGCRPHQPPAGCSPGPHLQFLKLALPPTRFYCS